ncbi:hypothetical protein H5410_038507 [Solanum commersonii]|uniref:Uncharacterized protein n=1 Tax=Solanum commersonii TaxID=4109 RepID=A0A9J5Y962_SOLCO|nr:hypothetical protein H5410_038507 [Solanum commersonii]
MEVEEFLNLFDFHWFQFQILKPKHPFSTTPILEPIKQILENPPKLSRTPTFMVRSQSDHCLISKDYTFDNISEKSQSPSPKSVLEAKLQPILSELEFEELKGFMDLGFEFSDKDKDSNLVSIIPGLKRLGMENERCFDENDESGVSRPHLSEAWGVWEEKKKMEDWKKNALKSWKINSDFGNEMEIKDQLKFWAHTVASTVR